MEEYIILQREEFRFLAAMAGIERVYSLSFLAEEDANAGDFTKEDYAIENDRVEHEAYVVLHQMVGKGIFAANEAEKETGKKPTFTLNEPYKSIVHVLKEAKEMANVTNEAGEKLCAYYGKLVVTMEASVHDDRCIRIGLYEKGKALQILEERGFLESEKEPKQVFNESLERIDL